ncbi:hypothetical protein [Tsukamurella soli]|uniref:hypothetical protein n=1 Tax=Tsukamurella soli TaxID=644556 RepID=UPI00360D9EC2
MAGRPPLRIGAHGKIRRVQLERDRWSASCRYRDTDGVVREVTRYTPAGTPDEYGDKAEGALLDHLDHRRPPGAGGITVDTKLDGLLTGYLERIRSGGDHAPKTIETYEGAVKILRPRVASVRVGELTAAQADDILRGIRSAKGDVRAGQAKVILRSIMLDAVLAGAVTVNPVDQLSRAKATGRKRRQLAESKGSKPVDHTDLPRLLKRLRTSHRCRRWDLHDPVLMFAATGMRSGELLGLRWRDVDLGDEPSVSVVGHIYRAKGRGWCGMRARRVATDVRCRCLGSPSACCAHGASVRAATRTPGCSPRPWGRCATR